MTTYLTEHTFTAVGVDVDDFDRWSDAVLDALIDSDTTIEADLVGSLTDLRMIFTFALEASSKVEAMDLAIGIMKKAVVDAGILDYGIADVVRSDSTARQLEPA